MNEINIIFLLLTKLPFRGEFVYGLFSGFGGRIGDLEEKGRKSS
jgi:hypothetical protein